LARIIFKKRKRLDLFLIIRRVFFLKILHALIAQLLYFLRYYLKKYNKSYIRKIKLKIYLRLHFLYLQFKNFIYLEKKRRKFFYIQ